MASGGSAIQQFSGLAVYKRFALIQQGTFYVYIPTRFSIDNLQGESVPLPSWQLLVLQ